MKKIILAAAFAAFASGSAVAGGFDGIYGGVEGGYGTHRFDGGPNSSAFQGGAFAGYGMTSGKLYLGGEGHVGIDGHKHAEAGVEYSRDLTYGATAKVGMVINRDTLGYVLGGWERSDAKVSAGGLSAKFTDDGYRFGAGVERVISGGISARTEASYTNWQGRGGMPKAGEFRSAIGFVARF